MTQSLSIPIVTLSVFTAIFFLLPSLTLAAPVQKTSGFVCPVFNTNAAVSEHNPNAVEIGEGDYTIPGPDVSVPLRATNANGAGIPGGAHSSPNDTDYTAIWAGQG